MKTAVYTICKNEINNVKRWLYYGSFYDYRVLLDTGSTDGTWELLQECVKTDENLKNKQKVVFSKTQILDGKINESSFTNSFEISDDIVDLNQLAKIISKQVKHHE